MFVGSLKVVNQYHDYGYSAHWSGLLIPLTVQPMGLIKLLIIYYTWNHLTMYKQIINFKSLILKRMFETNYVQKEISFDSYTWNHLIVCKWNYKCYLKPQNYVQTINAILETF